MTKPKLSPEENQKFYRRSCKFKSKFDSRLAAVAAMKELKKSSQAAYVNQLQAYPCRFCDGWHLGTAKIQRSRRAGR